MWTPLFTLRSHLDSVRGVFFTTNAPLLITVSEVSIINYFKGLPSISLGYLITKTIKN